MNHEFKPVGRCQHCNVQIFNRDDADPALDRMAHLCWMCVKPHGVYGEFPQSPQKEV